MNFQSQKKILDPLLKNSQNNNCADCSATTPSWASLDFGVFLCSNCSGAHRALGPTVTRVKSATLDLWQQEWIGNMLIGNKTINQYWEAIPTCHEKKPRFGSNSQDISRYVYEKYIKRKFVIDGSQPHPLALYKKTGSIPKGKEQKKEQAFKECSKGEDVGQKEEFKERIKVLVPQKKQVAKEVDLLSFDVPEKPRQKYEALSEPALSPHKKPVADIISFDEPVQAPLNQGQQRDVTLITEHGTSFTTENSRSDFISFDEMMSSNKNPQPPTQPPVQLTHSISTSNVNRGPNLTVPSHQVHPHHNMVFNQLTQHHHLGHHYAQSPQPQVHHNGFGQATSPTLPFMPNQPHLKPPQHLGQPKWS